jgi:hypothetical protein
MDFFYQCFDTSKELQSNSVTLITNSRIKFTTNAGVGNYFRSRARLLIYLWLADQISVKKANFKLPPSGLMLNEDSILSLQNFKSLR